jgi:hypothetical protein
MMADDFDQIPFEWIAKDLKNGKVIPFLGAGASAFPPIEAKPPSAAALALSLARQSTHPEYRLAAECSQNAQAAATRQQLEAYIDCTNLASVASWVELVRGDRERIREELRDALTKPGHPLPFNDLHALLADVAVNTPLAIITTNYDDLIEEALKSRGVPFDLFVVAIDRQPEQGAAPGVTLFRRWGEQQLQPVTGGEQLLQIEKIAKEIRLKRSALFKLHGHVDRSGHDDDTFVITEEDYVGFLAHMSLIPGDLETLLRSRWILFLGYGLRDWNLRVLLAQLRLKRKSYAITYGVSEVERTLWARRSVDVYDADIGRFVAALREKLKPAAVPANA